jgi:hypothetical protein
MDQGTLDVELSSLELAAKNARKAGDFKKEKELKDKSERLLEDAAYAIMRKQIKAFLK